MPMIKVIAAMAMVVTRTPFWNFKFQPLNFLAHCFPPQIPQSQFLHFAAAQSQYLWQYLTGIRFASLRVHRQRYIVHSPEDESCTACAGVAAAAPSIKGQ
jgi:hypothetical protein